MIIADLELPDGAVPDTADHELQRAVLSAQRNDLVMVLQGLAEVVRGRGDGAARMTLSDAHLADDLVHLARAVLDAPVASPAERQRIYVASVLGAIATRLAGSAGLVGGVELAQRAAALRDRVMAAEVRGPGLRVV